MLSRCCCSEAPEGLPLSKVHATSAGESSESSLTRSQGEHVPGSAGSCGTLQSAGHKQGAQRPGQNAPRCIHIHLSLTTPSCTAAAMTHMSMLLPGHVSITANGPGVVTSSPCSPPLPPVRPPPASASPWQLHQQRPAPSQQQPHAHEPPAGTAEQQWVGLRLRTRLHV
jgi:hypothetical protein